MKIELDPSILVYTGRARGGNDRKRYGLDRVDGNDEVVEVVVPDAIYTVTSSYFLGLFGDSVRALGREAFVRKYPLTGPKHVTKKLDDWIARALREKRGLFGGDI
jgi:hypothetical protein